MPELDEFCFLGVSQTHREPTRARFRRVVGLASRQHRLVSANQLRVIGVDRATVHRWFRDGRLERVYRGVYLVGPPGLSEEGRWLAAVMAYGPRALLSHVSAAVLWGMLERDPLTIDVTAPRGRRGRDGIRVHQASSSLFADDDRKERGIPVTSPARTFVDLASMAGRRTLIEALRAGQRQELLEPLALLPSLPPSRGRRGIALAREVLSAYVPAPGRVRSGFEQEYWELCVAHGPPLPLVNVRIAGHEADFVWPELALIIETDGDAWHGTDVDRVRDAKRDATHRALGYEVVRVAEPQPGEWASVAARHAAILERAAGRRSGPDR